MQAEQNPQSWRIEVRAKARNFNFKFNATKLSPTWKFHRLSLLLKLHSFFLGLNSHSSPSIPTQPQQQTLKSKLRRILSKIRSKTTKKWPNRRKSKTNSALNRLQKYTKEKPICFGSLLALILGLVIRKREIFVYFLGILVCIALLLLKKFESVKANKFLVLSIAIMAFSCSVVFDFTNLYMKYMEGYASKYAGLLWKFIASLIWNTLRN